MQVNAGQIGLKYNSETSNATNDMGMIFLGLTVYVTFTSLICTHVAQVGYCAWYTFRHYVPYSCIVRPVRPQNGRIHQKAHERFKIRAVFMFWYTVP